jgi:hypothetical protein
VLLQSLHAEDELEEDVHFDGILGTDQSAVVIVAEFLDAEERQVGKDPVEGGIAAVGAGTVDSEQGLAEGLVVSELNPP